MSNFTRYDAPLKIQYHKEASTAFGKDYWVVTEPFVYYVDNETSGTYVCVPTGFLTDGASVPRAFWSIISPWGEYGQAAVMHDYLCEYGVMTQTVYDENGVASVRALRCDRLVADTLFYEAMVVLDVPKWKRYVMRKAVAFYRRVFNKRLAFQDPLKTELELQIRDNIIHGKGLRLTQEQMRNCIIKAGDKS